MRLSHAKINHVTNLLIDYLRNDPAVEFFQDDSDIRMEIARLINEELKDDEVIDTEVRATFPKEAKSGTSSTANTTTTRCPGVRSSFPESSGPSAHLPPQEHGPSQPPGPGDVLSIQSHPFPGKAPLRTPWRPVPGLGDDQRHNPGIFRVNLRVLTGQVPHFGHDDGDVDSGEQDSQS